MMEYLNGVAVENPNLELAYDGVPLFSDVNGDGGDRFGVSGGNIQTGSGATAAAVITDLHSVQQRLLDMKDETANKPIFKAENVTFDKMYVLAPNSMNLAIQKAAKATYIQTNPALTVAENNYLVSTFSFGVNPFLTDNDDWFVLLKHPYWKPFILRPPQDINSVVTNIQNSDKARMQDVAGIYTDMRFGVGCWMPQTIVKVTNNNG